MIGTGAWQTVYAILDQIFIDITNWNSFNRNFRFPQTMMLLPCNTLKQFGYNLSSRNCETIKRQSVVGDLEVNEGGGVGTV